MAMHPLRFLPALLLLFVSLQRAAFAEARLALVMGVGEYDGTSNLHALPGIMSDLNGMKASLEKVGFKVTLVPNPTLVEAEEAIEKFGEELSRDKGVGLFYFSGHGGEFEGKNYLIPKAARLGKPRDVKLQAVAVDRVLARMEEAKNETNIIFLDCCRNDMSKAAGNAPGMATMQARGTFIGYATASEKFAQASASGSPYTMALARNIPQQGVSINDMHTRVTREVEDMTAESGESQTPFQYSGLNAVFFFQPSSGRTLPPVDPPKPAPPPSGGGGTKLPPLPRPPQPPPPPAPPPVVKDDTGITDFFIKWWDHQSSDEAEVWASDFQSPCQYGYATSKTGLAYRDFISEDRRKLIVRYTRRIYSLLARPQYVLSPDGQSATLVVRFEYRFSGKKITRGQALVEMKLARKDTGWLISAYKETVDKGEIQDAPAGGDNPPPQPQGNVAAARAALPGFVKLWWTHQSSDDADVWAADFRDPCDYCYGEGKSTRAFIAKDRRSLLGTYDRRVLRPAGEPDVTLADNGLSATMKMTYHYAYSGRKTASGTATITLSLLWNGSSWGISKYSEKTRRD